MEGSTPDGPVVFSGSSPSLYYLSSLILGIIVIVNILPQFIQILDYI